MLPGGEFPLPDEAGLIEYLKWDDWKVLGLLANGGGGDHGQRLRERNHFRCVYQTPETPSYEDLQKLQDIRTVLGGLLAGEGRGEASWYKTGQPDIPILLGGRLTKPLSELSKVVAAMTPNNQILLYVRPENVGNAKGALKKVLGDES